MLISASGVLLPCPSLGKFRQYCGWAEWEAWGSCSSTCGQGPVHRYTGGRLWTAVDGCGRLWTAVDGCGRLWTAVDGCGRLWTAEPTNLGLPLRSSGHWFLHVTDIHRRSWLIFTCYININIYIYVLYTHIYIYTYIHTCPSGASIVHSSCFKEGLRMLLPGG